MNFEERFFKRTMDIVCCLLALAVSWPFMIAIAIAIKAEDGGPVFYRQKRCTRDNREFNILNLRWMEVVHELHKIQARIRWIISTKYTTFWLPNGFRHSTAGFAGVFAA